MEILETAIPEVKIIVPKVFGDARGFFLESWNQAKYTEVGVDADWIQDNESKSRCGVLRGLHYQAAPYTQAKLVHVMQGKVLDIVVDIRRGSPTFGRHVAVELSGENKYQLFSPRGVAHGFPCSPKKSCSPTNATTATCRPTNAASPSTIPRSALTGRST